jgi:hypothetical protein
MALNEILVKEACLELWNQYHEEVEKLGYFLGKDSFMRGGPEEFSIIAMIRPKYDAKMSEIFRKLIPQEFTYKGEKIKVIVSPSPRDLDQFFF